MMWYGDTMVTMVNAVSNQAVVNLQAYGVHPRTSTHQRSQRYSDIASIDNEKDLKFIFQTSLFKGAS